MQTCAAFVRVMMLHVLQVRSAQVDAVDVMKSLDVLYQVIHRSDLELELPVASTLQAVKDSETLKLVARTAQAAQ